jgi:hypothetical protein
LPQIPDNGTATPTAHILSAWIGPAAFSSPATQHRADLKHLLERKHVRLDSVAGIAREHNVVRCVSLPGVLSVDPVPAFWVRRAAVGASAAGQQFLVVRSR